ncbi:hypothetical protein ILYODFUR_037621 [Ilyodon furcidens]|uniref:Secreted protein n=1 Tax=Ilyodon furcidens TaxID=33524 RepID=A0ABV0TEE8_9TELE
MGVNTWSSLHIAKQECVCVCVCVCLSGASPCLQDPLLHTYRPHCSVVLHVGEEGLVSKMGAWISWYRVGLGSPTDPFLSLQCTFFHHVEHFELSCCSDVLYK